VIDAAADATGAVVTETGRLVLRRLRSDDCAFILELLNDPSWIRYIGNKGVRTLEGARTYLDKGPLKMYQELGFGLNLVELKESHEPIGICGLIKRPGLESIDIGFAFLPQFRGQGYAAEAASATLAHARQALGLSRIVAIVTPDNEPSRRLLRKTGFQLEGTVRLEPDGQELELHSTALTGEADP
jgi:ribosomal-protein-alanine N-acetyltransferase